MRSDAKPSTAGSNQRRARGLGRVFGGSFAARGASAGAKGSGAPSRRGSVVAVAATTVLLSLIAAVPAVASQEVINVIGNPAGGALGGEFAFQPPGIAVNGSGAGPANVGDFYVADEGNNRVQRFTATGKFISAWGANVERRVEEQSLDVVAATGGTFTLTFDGSTTAPIPYDASNAAIDDALDVLPSIGGDANVTLRSNPPRRVAFIGALTGIDVPQMTANVTSLDGPAHRAVKIDTIENGWGGGGDDYELCTLADKCNEALAHGGNGTAGGNGALNRPQGVAVDNDTGDVYVSDRNNRRINVYDGEGIFIRSFGWDVAESGPGNTGTGYEICEASEGDVCKAGVAGSGVGQYGSGTTAGTFGIAVSPADGEASTGTVFLADTGNRRVGTFGLDGSSPSVFGSAAQFDSSQPRQIAVDSRGVVYTSNTSDEGRVDRYDSEDANGGGVGFLEPMVGSANEVQTINLPDFSSEKDLILTCPDGTETEPAEIPIGGLAPRVPFLLGVLETGCGEPGDFGVRLASGDLEVTFAGNLGKADLPLMQCTVVEGFPCSVTPVRDGHPGPLLSPYPEFPAGATIGLAVDSGEDALYAFRSPDAGNQVVQQFGPDDPPGLTGAATDADDTHAQGAGFVQSSSAVAIDEASGRLLLVQDEQVWFLAEPSSVAAPSVEVGPPTAVGSSGATFAGTVDPQGALVSCSFQYSTDQASWTDVPAEACDSLTVDGGPQAIEQEIAGLDPATGYFVRLSVSRPFIEGTTVTPAIPFETDAAPPVVADLGAMQVTDTSARLAVTINPRNAATGYVFEYGKTPALGSSTPPLDIGGGTTPITVSQVIGGLSKDTTYHFRAVATNSTGTTVTTSRTFRTRAVPVPSSTGRAYEQVTPVEKNYGDTDTFPGNEGTKAQASITGDAVGFCAMNQFGEPPGRMNLLCSPYISRRTANGWVTPNDNFPPFCHFDTESGREEGTIAPYPSPDFSRTLFRIAEYASCEYPPLDPAAPVPGPEDAPVNLYVQDTAADPSSYALLNTQAEPFGTTGAQYQGGSDDFSHVVYRSLRNQTPDSPPEGNYQKLYEWIAAGEEGCAEPGGCLRLVSVKPNGEPLESQAAVGATGSYRNVYIEIADSVSDDGSRIYFSAPITNICQAAGCQLYMREGGAVTHHVSASECTVECGASEASSDPFLDATPSGDKAFFTSCDKLVDGSATQPGNSCTASWSASTSSGAPGSKLYRWDRNAPPGGQLVDLSADHESTDGAAPGFLGLVGSSDDGDTAYFAARGQIVSGKPTFPGDKLYRWRWNGGSPDVEYLGPYSSLVPHNEDSDFNIMQQHRQVSADGKYVTIYTELAIDAAGDRDEDADLYRWDEDSGWICISCQLPGAPSNGPVDVSGLSFENEKLFGAEAGSVEPVRYMTEDGQRIVFGTPDALLPADTNGELGCPLDPIASARALVYTCEDVYEWHDGRLSLISTGTGSEAARLISMDRTGRDVFFFTRERLVGWDRDNNVDIYDARIGGGFPEPTPQPAECEGEGCRGEGSDAPAIVGAGSAVFQGPGNPKAEAQGNNRCPANRLRRGKRCLTVAAIARKRCRRLSGQARRRCVRRQARQLRRAQRRANRRAQRRMNRANANRRAVR